MAATYPEIHKEIHQAYARIIPDLFTPRIHAVNSYISDFSKLIAEVDNFIIETPILWSTDFFEFMAGFNTRFLSRSDFSHVTENKADIGLKRNEWNKDILEWIEKVPEKERLNQLAEIDLQALFGEKARKHEKRKIKIRNKFYQHYIFAASPLIEELEQAFIVEGKTLLFDLKNNTAKLEAIIESKGQKLEKQEIISFLMTLQAKAEEGNRKMEDFKLHIRKQVDTFVANASKKIFQDIQAEASKQYGNSTPSLKRLVKQNEKFWSTYLKKWKKKPAQLPALFEDWNFDVELYRIKNQSFAHLITRLNSIVFAKRDQVLEKLERARTFLIDMNQNLGEDQQESNLLDKISVYRNNLQTLLTDTDLHFSNAENQELDLLQVLDQVLERTNADLSSLTTKRSILKKEPKNEDIHSSDLVTVYPRELVQFEMFPTFQSRLQSQGLRIKEATTQFEMKVIDANHFIDYSLDTSANLLTSEDSTREEAVAISHEGFEKGVAKMDELIADAREIFDSFANDLQAELKSYTTAVMLLTRNSAVHDLRTRLLKAKILNQIRQTRSKVSSTLQTTFQQLISKSGWVLKKSTGVTEQLVKFYNQSDLSGKVSAELSSFLSEVKNSLENLPIIYQRLFKLTPINSGYLFYERKKAQIQMRTAYHNWRLGRFSAMAVIAEKGAGITSSIDHFLLSVSYEVTMVDFSNGEDLFREKNLLIFLADSLGFENITSEEDLLQAIEAKKNKIIVQAEGLQRLFLRKVDGFDALFRFFEIISRTNQKIFWIVSCTYHAWQFLERTKNISEYFGYSITLGAFSDDEMVEIVQKRHKVSGIGLQFLPSSEDNQNSKFKRLSAEQKQDFLSKKYFLHLNKLSNGNISIALIFWLSSANGIKDNTLQIKSMNNFDTSFIKGMSQDKLFDLYALLLHDGLSLQNFCKVLRYSPDHGRIRIMQMLDDGLILKKKDRYEINLLLLRSIIQALQSNNMLQS